MPSDHDNYWQAVQYLAENIVAELADEDPEEDRDETLARLVHDRTDQHDYVIRDDLQIQYPPILPEPLCRPVQWHHAPGISMHPATISLSPVSPLMPLRRIVIHKVKLLLEESE